MVDARVSRIMDIKTPGSGEVGKKPLVQPPPSDSAHDEVKFVLCDEADYQWAVEVMREHQLNRICPILFSPVYGKLDPSTLADGCCATACRYGCRSSCTSYCGARARGDDDGEESVAQELMAKALCCCPGGLDSATTLAIAHSSGYNVYALSIDYGQRHVSELAAAAKLAQSVRRTRA